MIFGERSGRDVLEGDTWKVRLLSGPPLIAPARQYIFPQAVPGEEEALARGSMYLEVQRAVLGSFLAQCALGFNSATVAHGLWQSPCRSECLAVAGGYAYALQLEAPERTQLLPMRPVVEVAATAEYLLLVGFHDLLVRTADQTTWRSPRLSWEGVTLHRLIGTLLEGTAWDMSTDEEVPFTLDLETRALEGGGYRIR